MAVVGPTRRKGDVRFPVAVGGMADVERVLIDSVET
jgi:hypothetical protein